MPIYEKPVRRQKGDRPARRRERVARIQADDVRAQVRYCLVAFTRGLDASLSLNARVAAVRQALADGTLKLPDGVDVRTVAPGRSSVHRWLQLADDGVSIEQLRDRPRAGRPREPLAAALERVIVDACATGREYGPRDLHRLLEKKATELSLEAPSYEQVRLRLSELMHVLRSVGRHGKRAGLADATVHAAVPAERPHAVWTLDELDAPVWVKVYSHVEQAVVATKPVVILVVDQFTGLIVGYHVVNPLRRDTLRGFDGVDVRAAFVGTCLPEIANNCCAPFGGYLPDYLRLDRHGSHEELRQLARTLHIEVPDLAGLAPWARGSVEAQVKAVKQGLRHVRGFAETAEVAEHISGENREAVRVAAGTMERETVKSPYAIDQLMNLDEFTNTVDNIIREINARPRKEGREPSRQDAYLMAHQHHKCRSGADAWSLLIPSTATTQKNGIAQGDIVYLPVDTTVALLVNERLTLRLDPGLRALYVVQKDGTRVLCRPSREVAATRSAAGASKAAYALVSLADRIAAAARQRHREAELTAAGCEHADAIAKEQRNALPGIAKRHQEERRAATARRKKARAAAKSAGQRPTSTSPTPTPDLPIPETTVPQSESGRRDAQVRDINSAPSVRYTNNTLGGLQRRVARPTFD